ncbi:thioredoxin domain-containing protein [Bradyrhizobium hipponense]|nr:DUF255 domain-containing protein [Bradyrhizobium hipponense]
MTLDDWSKLVGVTSPKGFMCRLSSTRMIRMTESVVGLVKRLLKPSHIGLAVVAGMAWPHTHAAMADNAASGDTSRDRSTAQYEHTNKLIDSNDPYLLLHAHNPVDWYPWGPEAFAKAKSENKPIFLSIGYSTCFWCHVAERTIYSNPDIAKLMNRWFINVKVDSEERPDVDRIYMHAREIMTGGGGWPNNLFLTPDLKPFYAGSYFPPKDDPRAGPGFPTILAALNQAWASDRAKVLGVGENVTIALRRLQSAMSSQGTAPVDPGAWLTKARDKLLPQFDALQGGFADRGGTKFPNSPRLLLLLTDYQLNHTPGALSNVLATLDAVAFGGIHDQLAGCFHRYSTEPSWSVPHFEKMLYDNAQLRQLYSTAFQLTKKPLYQEIALETARYLARDMLAPVLTSKVATRRRQHDSLNRSGRYRLHAPGMAQSAMACARDGAVDCVDLLAAGHPDQRCSDHGTPVDGAWVCRARFVARPRRHRPDAGPTPHDLALCGSFCRTDEFRLVQDSSAFRESSDCEPVHNYHLLVTCRLRASLPDRHERGPVRRGCSKHVCRIVEASAFECLVDGHA